MLHPPLPVRGPRRASTFPPSRWALEVAGTWEKLADRHQKGKTTVNRGGLALGVARCTFGIAHAEAVQRIDTPSGPVWVGAPVVPIATPAVRDLPDWSPDPNAMGLEMKRREDYGFLPIPYPIKPTVDPLLYRQEAMTGPGRQVDAFSSPLFNFAGQQSSSSPPDTVGDVGPNHFVQAVNQAVSTVQVLSKVDGAILKTFTMQSLTTATPCRNGFCDPVVLYDRAADRWLISELPSSGGSVCVYVSQTPDPTGAWWAYSFAVETGTTD